MPNTSSYGRQEMQQYQLNLSEQEVNIVLLSLTKQPWEAVNELIVNIRKQATEQLTPVAEG